MNTPPTDTTTTDISRERLQLADWRRRFGELYAEVRSLGWSDPTAAHELWQVVREKLYQDHPSTPVKPELRAGFRALHFDYDSRLRFELPLILDAEPVAPPPPTEAQSEQPASTPGHGLAGLLGLKLPISTGVPLAFERVGRLDVPFESGTRRLTLFWLPEYSGGLFLPFRDRTNGHETYGGGRYLLDTAKGADLGGDPNRATVVVDFNFAYQPSCAFDPRWSCPLSPPDNLLDLEIRAGERIA